MRSSRLVLIPPSHLLGLALLASCTPAPSSSPSPVAPASVQPEAPRDSSWSSIENGIVLSQYQFRRDGPALVGSNDRQGLSAHFHPGAVTFSTRETKDEMQFDFSAWGRIDRMKSVTDVSPVIGPCLDSGEVDADGECLPRLEYRHSLITEWWANRPNGMEHGWNVAEAPQGTGALLFEITVEGAALDADPSGDAVWLTTDSGEALRYSGPLAWDANGTPLPALLEAEGDVLRVVVDDAGAVYPITVDPTLTTLSWTKYGVGTGYRLGQSVAGIGDINGDGYSDVAVGAPGYTNGQSTEGKVFIFLGSQTGMQTTAFWSYESDRPLATFGRSIATMVATVDLDGDNKPDPIDINSDGYPDLLVGAPNDADPTASQGRAYLFLGTGVSGVPTGISSTPVWEGQGDGFHVYFGSAIAGVGDVNDDGFGDFVVGAPAGTAEGGYLNNGKAYVYYGSATVPTLGMTLEGQSLPKFGLFGASIATLGDINGDGISDFGIGAPNEQRNFGYEGTLYIYIGTGIPTDTDTADTYIPPSTSQGPVLYKILTGGSSFGRFGNSFAPAGDIDADGIGDFLVGAPNLDDVGAGYGRIALFYGSVAPLSDTPVWEVFDTNTRTLFGASVAGLGDIDANGYGDFAVGAPYQSNGQSREGAVYVFRSNRDGIWSTFFFAESDQTEAHFGYVVANAGDIDGDHYNDLIIGSPDYDQTLNDEGRVQIYDHLADADGDGFAGKADCDDTDPDAYPGAPEFVADGIDQDCDGTDVCYTDVDLDGFAGTTTVIDPNFACTSPGEWSIAEDCDDTSNVIYPAAPEIAVDGIDQDCDTGDLCYVDGDGDSYGSTNVIASTDMLCSGIGEAMNADDCDDANIKIYPGADETVGDAIDQDCDGFEQCYQDNDNDDYGTETVVPSTDTNCDDPGEAMVATDCNDNNSAINPGATDIHADGINQDCSNGDRCYLDTDHDGYGKASSVVESADLDCLDLGESGNATDCDDAAFSVNPGGTDTPGDGINQDCSGGDKCYQDSDSDTWGSTTVIDSSDLDCADSKESSKTGDCNDSSTSINPSATDTVADGVDQNCDGGDRCYQDSDHDWWGITTIINSTDLDCADVGESTASTDCNDGSATVYPGATEIVNDGINQDCSAGDVCYTDADKDSYGVNTVINSSDLDCKDTGEADDILDCNDANANVKPGATEVVGDGVDNNCDGLDYCYQDIDDDNYGSSTTVLNTNSSCADGLEASVAGDCDDNDAVIKPGATEIVADAIDQDCNGGDRCYKDGDKDTYGSTTEINSSDLDCIDTGESKNNTDCNDSRGASYPGATETVANSYDDNCDGFEECYSNADGDAHGALPKLFSTDIDCTDSGEASTSTDCNDNDKTIYPGASEIVGDGIDQDCNGGERCYVDNDLDTYGSSAQSNSTDLDCTDSKEAETGDDCDDAVAAIHPGGTEIIGDGIDQDCTGLESCYQDLDGDSYGTSAIIASNDLDCVDPEITQTWYAKPDTASVLLGYEVASGDVNGDGYSDVIAGAPLHPDGVGYGGAVYIYYGGANGLPSIPSWQAPSPSTGAYFGASVAAADVNNDGYDDVIVGAPKYGADNHGAMYVYHGSANGPSPTADWTIASSKNDEAYGSVVANAGDVNNDGYEDVAMSSSAHSNGQTSEGGAWIFHGSATGLPANPSWSMELNQTGMLFGQSISSAGDINNDGYGDIVVGAPNAGNQSAGRAYIYMGSATGLPSTYARELGPGATYSYVGEAVGTANVNGDAYDDVIVGARGGTVYVYLGAGSGLSTTVAWSVNRDQVSSNFGYVVSGIGDLNADGYDELAIGAPLLDNGQTDEGRISVYYGTASGPGTAIVWKTEANTGTAKFASAISGPGDFDADGFGDFLVGAPYEDPGKTDEGKVYLFEGGADGYSIVATDCDDTDFAVKPGGNEAPGDSKDQDCDGEELCYKDADHDTFGADFIIESLNLSCLDTGEAINNTDCNDAQAGTNPNSVEVIADGKDQNCDNGDLCYLDADGDGFGGLTTVGSADLDCLDAGESLTNDDCDDANPFSYPGTVEIPGDGKDQDCDDGDLCFVDGDLDGYGIPTTVSSVDLDCKDAGEANTSDDCEDDEPLVHPNAFDTAHNGLDEDCDGADSLDADKDGYDADFAGGEDCHDYDDEVFPGQPESVDGVDEDCNGLVDDTTEVYDYDQDGFTEVGGDCDDSASTIRPGGYEIPDGKDQDCDDEIDEFTSLTDDDFDGYTEDQGDCDDSNADVSPAGIEVPNGIDDNCSGIVDEDQTNTDDDGDGITDDGGDCNDYDAEIRPGALEIADEIDNDCDGETDEGTEWGDDDDDGFAEYDGDCDDGNASINPDGTEIVNGLDDDCDDETDENIDLTDDDGDGYAESEGDCNDNNDDIHPGVTEVADAVDQDCNGLIDEHTEAFDDDGDGVTEADGDCDDTLVAVAPTRTETCTTDGDQALDENCNGVVDEGCDDGEETVPVKPTTCTTGGTGAGSGLALGLAAVATLRRRRRVLGLLALFGVGSGCSEFSGTDQSKVQIEVSPSYWADFGTVTVGRSMVQTLEIRNAGDKAVTMTRVDCDLAPGVSPLGDPDGTTLAKADDGNASYYDLSLEYLPTEEAVLEGWCNLDFADQDNSSIQVGMFGHATAPSIWLDPGVIDFGLVQNGTETEEIRFVNAGLAPIQIASMDHTDDTFDYVLPDDDGADLMPGDEVVITVSTDRTDPVSDVLSITLSEGQVFELPIQANICDAPLVIRDSDDDGSTECGGDCNDFLSGVHPGAAEIEDGIDQDCDDIVDEGTNAFDDDEDGFSENEGDCNDEDVFVFPGSTADLPGVDQNCDNFLEGADNDGDGYTIDAGDCNDLIATIRPGGTETANAADDDCDGTIDEGTTWFDDDGDCFCESGTCTGGIESACTVLEDGDCMDADVAMSPVESEIINGWDDDCNGDVDDGTIVFDDDGDGFSEQGGDCDDEDVAINPSEFDPPNDGTDWNCDLAD